MYNYVFCCYVESEQFKPLLSYTPLAQKSIEKGLKAALEDFQEQVGSYPPTRIEHRMYRLQRTPLGEDTRWVMARSGAYAGIIGMLEEIGLTGVGLLELETGITYLMPKEDVVEIPHWDFEAGSWTIDNQ